MVTPETIQGFEKDTTKQLEAKLMLQKYSAEEKDAIRDIIAKRKAEEQPADNAQEKAPKEPKAPKAKKEEAKAKAPKAKAEKPVKEPKAPKQEKPAKEKKVGVIQSIQDVITGSPKTVNEIVAELAKLFPDKSADSMKQTVMTQIGTKKQPTRMEREKGIKLTIETKEEKTYYSI